MLTQSIEVGVSKLKHSSYNSHDYSSVIPSFAMHLSQIISLHRHLTASHCRACSSQTRKVWSKKMSGRGKAKPGHAFPGDFIALGSKVKKGSS